jgi:hypothetical protein
VPLSDQSGQMAYFLKAFCHQGLVERQSPFPVPGGRLVSSPNRCW